LINQVLKKGKEGGN